MVAAVLVGVLVAVGGIGACTGGTTGDDVGAVTGTGADPIVAATAADAAGDEAGADTDGFEELTVRWAERRDDAVDSLRSQGYGLPGFARSGDGDGLGGGLDESADADADAGSEDPQTLRGPGRFQLDLGRCPDGWSDTAGVSRSEIVLAVVLPTTGEQAKFGQLAVGIEAYFDHVNARGGVGGRQLTLEVRDDGYEVENTEDVVDGLLDADRQPLAVTTFGTANSFAVYEDLNQACVPHPFVMSAHPAWGDPERFPWTIGLQMSYATEAVIWGNWMKRNLSERAPLTVGALIIDNDLGLAYSSAFDNWAGSNPTVVGEIFTARHSPSETDVSAAMVSLAEKPVDVLLTMTAGQACSSALIEAASSGAVVDDAVVFLPSVCRDPQRYLLPAGAAADGARLVDGGVKALDDPQYADEGFAAVVSAVLAEAGVDDPTGLAATGVGQYAWPYVEVLRIAADLDGGLRRSNLLLALRSMDLNHPQLADGVRFETHGLDDAYPIEGSKIARFDLTRGGWVNETEVIDVNGGTPDCLWDDDGC